MWFLEHNVVHVNVDLYKNGVIPDGYTVPCAYSYNLCSLFCTYWLSCHQVG